MTLTSAAATPGVLNFRDMGGYAAAGGRRVRRGLIYRAGACLAMSEADIAFVDRTGIRLACDLRSNMERSRYPNHLQSLADIEYWYRDHDRPPGDLQRLTLAPDATAERTRELMRSLYRTLPDEFRDAYRDIFRLLAQGRVPLVFNCAAGKDRTGVFAALLLTALEVSRTDVFRDYLLTEQVFEQLCTLFIERRKQSTVAAVRPEVWHPMMRADATYLESMFAHLEYRHGSVDGYLETELGVDRELRAQLHDILLEPAVAR